LKGANESLVDARDGDAEDVDRWMKPPAAAHRPAHSSIEPRIARRSLDAAAADTSIGCDTQRIGDLVVGLELLRRDKLVRRQPA
jgi:hypothetical protein